MSQELWTAVDNYIVSKLLPGDSSLDQAVRASEEAGLPSIQVSPAQGKFLYLLAKVHGAKRILEIGTLGGYSTIWLARALPPDGCLITLELNPKHAEVARKNITRAGLENVVEVRQGPALSSLAQLVSEGAGPFDLVFIDAHKPEYTEYFQWSLKLARPGTLIIADNVVRNGAVADPASTDELVLGIRRFNDAVAKESRVAATALQTVSEKGYDGLMVAVVGGNS